MMMVIHRSATHLAQGAVGTSLLTALFIMSVFCSKADAQLPLTPVELASASAYLRSTLAAADERAYLQVLTQASVVADSTDTSVVYDLVVRYDPERFRDPHMGLYPLTFEDQFIQWGKRIALFTRSTQWPSQRFYLQDLAHGQTAWIHTSETRLLYPPDKRRLPGSIPTDDRPAQRRWLRLMHATEAATDLQSMTRWLRLMRREPRDVVLIRSAEQVAARDSTNTP
ncbi:MAG: hypothetical protein HN712_17435 [Gemmatimonadetes bacterium]|jgi:hypothetical protein|nr:hypothetical protein [Gemmatimonadota bacterium]MBT6147960.1 hypothetical protein [Gemmatimonadota bacterium]MBT7862103.1 hypothetical protein [Gemmatimonadota bacterium]